MPEIVLVDDETAYCRAVASLLAREGLRVSAYSGAQQLLEEGRWKRADLVITDVAMPGLDGIDLALRLRGRGYSGHFLLMTGLDQAMIAPWIEALAPCETVRKPFRLAELTSRIRAIRGGASDGS